ncbi:MAG: hypothetical protein WEC73_06100, partial [Chthoniobacterales bacterium]
MDNDRTSEPLAPTSRSGGGSRGSATADRLLALHEKNAPWRAAVLYEPEDPAAAFQRVTRH